VEQNCVYLDLDGKDKLALHLLFEGKVVAHARLIKPGISFDNASIGRVVVDANYRDRKGARFNARSHYWNSIALW
jgi:ElaA protein